MKTRTSGKDKKYAENARQRKALAAVEKNISDNNKNFSAHIFAALEVYYFHTTSKTISLSSENIEDVIKLVPENRQKWFKELFNIAKDDKCSYTNSCGKVTEIFNRRRGYDFGLLNRSYLYDCVNAALSIYRINNIKTDQESEAEKNNNLRKRKLRKSLPQAVAANDKPRDVSADDLNKTERYPTQSMSMEEFNKTNNTINFAYEIKHTFFDFIIFNLQKYKDNPILKDSTSVDRILTRLKKVYEFCNNDNELTTEEVNQRFTIYIKQLMDELSPDNEGDLLLKQYLKQTLREYNQIQNDLKFIYEPITVIGAFLSRKATKDLIDDYRKPNTTPASSRTVTVQNAEEALAAEQKLVLNLYDYLCIIHKTKKLKEEIEKLKVKINRLKAKNPKQQTIASLTKRLDSTTQQLKDLDENINQIKIKLTLNLIKNDGPDFVTLESLKNIDLSLDQNDLIEIQKAFNDLKQIQESQPDKPALTIWDKIPVTRTFHSRIWQPTKEGAVLGEKVVLLIHGLDDSTHTWETQARKYAAEGYTVIAYDQVGHGFDQMQTLKNSLNLKLMQDDLDQQLRWLEENNSVKSIHLVGHSAGAALLLNCKDMINATSKVKSAICISAAMFQNPTRDSISTYPTVRKATGDKQTTVVDFRGETTLNGPGASAGPKDLIRYNISDDKDSPSTTNFLHFASQAYKNAKALVSGQYQSRVSWKFISGEDDKLSPARNFRSLEKAKRVLSIGIHLLKKVGHHPHGPGSSTGEYVAEIACNHFKQSLQKKEESIFYKLVSIIEKHEKSSCNFDRLSLINNDSFKNLLIKKEELEIEANRANSKVKQKDIQRELHVSDEMTAFINQLIVRYKEGNLSFKTLVFINRAVHGEAAIQDFDINTEIKKYNSKKKFYQKEAQTIKDLRQLSQVCQSEGYYNCDIKLIAQLRDARTSLTFFREVRSYERSMDLFNDSMNNKLINDLSIVDTVISNLANPAKKPSGQ